MARHTHLLGALALLGATLTGLGTASPAAADYAERWCSTAAAPCIQSLSINGVAQSDASPVELVLNGPTDLGGYREVNLELSAAGAAPSPGDVLSVVINTGNAFVPDRMFGRLGLHDVDTWREGDGTHRIRITGTPVTWASGCDPEAAWPWPCPSTSTGDEIVFGADIAMLEDRDDSSIGMHAGTNAAFNGIFFDEQPDGSHALTTELVAPHYYADGTTPIAGAVRYRLSYRQMRSDMGTPNPETLTPGSLSGTINGGTGGGAFSTWHDPDGGGFFIQATGFTFSVKRIKVRPSRITPSRPVITRTQRTTSRKAVLTHTLATPRGAKVTGYQARCTPRRGAIVRSTGSAATKRVVVRGLRPGVSYTCRVAARSKAGTSAWSAKAKVRARVQAR
ncbi:fibronectin type III domain-containing protein [Nocardioides dubius]|uniref:Fibronectin type-III domain-containing protein n=1 Tax=Nocardioides dubius TaxID=317019 RepID=A0ABP4EKJ2_9ACTN